MGSAELHTTLKSFILGLLRALLPPATLDVIGGVTLSLSWKQDATSLAASYWDLEMIFTPHGHFCLGSWGSQIEPIALLP